MDHFALADRLYAECLAAPLRDVACFCDATLTVNDLGTEAQMRARAEAIRSDLSATAVDVERAIAEVRRTWTQPSTTDSSCRIVSMLARNAGRLLRPSGYEAILRVDRDVPAREILRWRFVTLAMPPAILIAASAAGGPVPLGEVRLLDSSIGPDWLVAHNHLHHAAMMSFEELWASLRVRTLVSPGRLVASLRDPRAFCPHLHPGVCLGGRSDAERALGRKHVRQRDMHMTAWAGVVRQAIIAGCVLDRHAHHRSALAECNDDDCRMLARTTLRAFLAGRMTPYREPGIRYPWPTELLRLAGRFRKARLFRHSQMRREFIRDQVAEERSLLARAFAYLLPAERKPRDKVYEALFLQYLRVKTAIFGLLVQPPGQPGLARFLDYFLQIKVYAPESDLMRPREPREPGLEVKATEYRVAPDAWFRILRRREIEIEERVPGESRHGESAWLIHFKRREPDVGKLPLFGSVVRALDGEADQIARALAAKPTRLRALRGIDICGVEEAQPLWVAAESLRGLRARSRKIAGGRPGLRLEPLRLTIHAGEDFRWLTSGIRAIAEPFQWNLIERGDRIGHGLAVTLEPEDWWRGKEGQTISVKRFDRLLDLAFLATYAGDLGLDEEDWLCEEIRSTVAPLGLASDRTIKTAPKLSLVETAKQVWSSLGGRLTRRLMEAPHWRYDARRLHEEWIHGYLWSRRTQRAATAQVWLKVDDDRNCARTENSRNERDLLVKARKRLIREMARWQVCIESNPTSNLVVGGLDTMGAAQDFLQRRPTRNEEGAAETLTWTISTDDPITFSTSLADEYAYAWAGMVLRNYDPSYARGLLDEAAATSMRMRFTIPFDDRTYTGRGKCHRAGRARRD